MVDEVITFQIDGPLIKDPYPLHEIVSILQDFHSIVDQSYLVLSDKKRITRSERLSYQILASHTKLGSYLQEFVIVCAAAYPLLASVTPQVTSSYIWQTTKGAFNFLKTVIGLRQQGKDIKMSAPDNKGIIVVGTPDSQLTINQTIIKVSDKAEEFYKRMTNQIEENRIDKITALDQKKEGISLTMNERRLFNPETKLEDKPVDLVGNIFDFNKDRLSGKLRVEEGQELPSREYNFGLIGNQDFIPYVIAMTKARVLLRCLPEIEIHTSGSKNIARLQAISVKEV